MKDKNEWVIICDIVTGNSTNVLYCFVNIFVSLKLQYVPKSTWWGENETANLASNDAVMRELKVR
jgi:hypothetical protein